MVNITIPHNWKPRYYQKPAWHALETGVKRAIMIWHRRAGKDDVCLHHFARSMLKKPATYWHLLPEAAQCRKAIWDAINPHSGKRRIDEAFPDELFNKRDHDMRVECKVNGSIYQLCGSDNYNSLVGSPPFGVVFSEWALADPQAWAYIRPILAENGGWAAFITTPRGRNHASSMFDMAKDSDEWFAEKLTVLDTNVFTKETLKSELKEYVSLLGAAEGKAKFDQEYHCSFDAALPGAYFGAEMNEMEAAGRLCAVPHTEGVPVYPCFDFGIGQSNSTSITFMQVVGREPRVVHYYEDNTKDIADYGKVLRDLETERRFFYGALILPHDGGYDRLATGMSYEAQFEEMHFETHVLSQTPAKELDIIEARKLIRVVWIDKSCKRLVDCLRSYHREWDVKLKRFATKPKHDWASHGADSFMQAAVAYRQGLLIPEMYGDNEYEEDYYNVDETRNATTGY